MPHTCPLLLYTVRYLYIIHTYIQYILVPTYIQHAQYLCSEITSLSIIIPNRNIQQFIEQVNDIFSISLMLF